MTLAAIPLRRAKPGTISTLHKGELRSGPQGHTWTEHRIALGTLSPMPRGLLSPKSNIFTWNSLGGGQAGFCAKSWSRSPQSAHLLVTPGEGPGQRGRPARREFGGLQVGGPASLQGPACSPHTQLIINVGTESYQNCFREICCLKGIWRNPAFIRGTLVIKSSLSISFLKSGLPSTWLYIKEEPNSIFLSHCSSIISWARVRKVRCHTGAQTQVLGWGWASLLHSRPPTLPGPLSGTRPILTAPGPRPSQTQAKASVGVSYKTIKCLHVYMCVHVCVCV